MRTTEADCFSASMVIACATMLSGDIFNFDIVEGSDRGRAHLGVVAAAGVTIATEIKIARAIVVGGKAAKFYDADGVARSGARAISTFIPIAIFIAITRFGTYLERCRGWCSGHGKVKVETIGISELVVECKIGWSICGKEVHGGIVTTPELCRGIRCIRVVVVRRWSIVGVRGHRRVGSLAECSCQSSWCVGAASRGDWSLVDLLALRCTSERMIGSGGGGGGGKT